MSYSKIDSVLYPWASKHSFIVTTEQGSNQRRVFHTSSKDGETFQVVIEPEKDSLVRIDGHLIEARNEEEVHYTWETSISHLRYTLDAIKRTIEVWFSRQLI